MDFLPKTEKELEKCLIFTFLKFNLVKYFLSAVKINFYLKNLKNFCWKKVINCKRNYKIHETFYREDVDKINMFKTSIKGELTVVISEKNIKDKPFKEDEIKKAKLF